MNFLYVDNIGLSFQGLLIKALIEDRDICNNRVKSPSLLRRIKNKIYSL